MRQLKASPRARATAFARAGAVAAVVIGLDQLTKHLIRNAIPLDETRKFFIGIQLVHYRNTGVAFSLFTGGGAAVLALTLAAVLALVVYVTRRPERPWVWLPTGLLVGGAAGNLVDRLLHGGVTDFIKLPLWPAFNVADIAITVGVIALLWVLEGPRQRER